MKAFFREVFQSLRSTMKWLLIIGLISGAGIMVVVVTTQWEAYQHVAHQVAQRDAQDKAGGMQ